MLSAANRLDALKNCPLLIKSRLVWRRGEEMVGGGGDGGGRGGGEMVGGGEVVGLY